MNIVNYYKNSELGLLRNNTLKSIMDKYHFTCRLPSILKEKEYDLSKSSLNKIFSAQWLDDRRAIVGTKCNRLLVLDTYTDKYFLMNPLKSHENSNQVQQSAGIHTISINPSRTLLATGSENVNDIAVYKLPNLEPLFVGYGSHKNWIFDTVWLDDHHVVSGANDSKLALWKVSANDFDYDTELDNDDGENNNEDDDEESSNYAGKRRRVDAGGNFRVTNSYKYKKASKSIKCKKGKRIRAIAYNKNRNEVAAITMNAQFCVFDAQLLEQKQAKKLAISKENVCMAINSDNNIYAIGSASHVQLMNADTYKSVLPPILVKKDIGVRSLNFRNNILSIGTGNGTVLFYDLRKLKFLQNDLNEKVKLESGGGWILKNDSYFEYISYAQYLDNLHAVYAHSYDPSGTKLLAAGGPLTVGLYGHYLSVWK